jgi:hypothetical protein
MMIKSNWKKQLEDEITKKKYKSPQVQQTTIKRIMTKFKRRKKIKEWWN